jgi:hypothetical protein
MQWIVSTIKNRYITKLYNDYRTYTCYWPRSLNSAMILNEVCITPPPPQTRKPPMRIGLCTESNAIRSLRTAEVSCYLQYTAITYLYLQFNYALSISDYTTPNDNMILTYLLRGTTALTGTSRR